MKKWYGGIMIKSLKQRRREVLEDPLLRRFYEEGIHYILYGGKGMKFEEVRQDLLNE